MRNHSGWYRQRGGTGRSTPTLKDHTGEKKPTRRPKGVAARNKENQRWGIPEAQKNVLRESQWSVVSNVAESTCTL